MLPGDREVREQGVVLEHGRGRPQRRRHARSRRARRSARRPHVGTRKPPRTESSVVLPLPDGPSRTT